MKILASLAVIVGVLALGTVQLEGVWAETLLRPFGFGTSVNSQSTTRIAVRGAEGVWHSPLGAPTQFDVQSANRIVVRGAEGVWRSPLSAPAQFNVQSSSRIVVRNADSLWTSLLDKPNVR